MESSGESPTKEPEQPGESRPWVGKGSVFLWLSRKFPSFFTMGSAISEADLPGWLAGPKRRPNLKPGKGSEFSTVRSVEQGYAYTQIQVNETRCPKCGSRVEEHTINNIDGDQGRHYVGTVRMCTKCQADSWMFKSHMPSLLRRKAQNERNVL